MNQLWFSRATCKATSAACNGWRSSHHAAVHSCTYARPSPKSLPHRASWLKPRDAVRSHATGQRPVGATSVDSPAITTPPDLMLKPWTGSPQEVEALEELERRMSSEPGVDPEQLRWFLRDRSFDVEEAEKKLRARLQWWQQLFGDGPLPQPELEKEAATGKVIEHPHPDVLGRPVIIISATKHVIGEFPPEDSQRLCVVTLERMIAKLPPGGEALLGVFDLKDFGPANADLGLCKFLVELFFVYYPKRMGQVLLVDAPWVFQPLWATLKPLLRKYAALVRFVSREELREEYFTPDTVPEAFR